MEPETIVDWLYNGEGVVPTLSELRPNLDYRQTIANLVDYLWGEPYNDCLELTISFKESVLNTYTEGYIKKLVKQVLPKRFRIFLLADYSTVGRFHLHGVIKPLNGTKGMDYFKRKLTRLFGRTELKPLNSRYTWLCYITKYYYENKHIIGQSDYITNDPLITRAFEKRSIEQAQIEDTFKQIEKLIISKKD